MSLWEYIDWDIDEEKEKNRKMAEKILGDFPDVEGLRMVLDDVQSLMDSEVYDNLYQATELDPEEVDGFAPPSVEFLLEHFRQDRYASKVLKNPPLNLFTDNIIFSHYLGTSNFIGFIHFVYKGQKLTLKDCDFEHTLHERLMVFLDNFDQPGEYTSPDEEYYKKLKKIKWDKKAKKLFKRILKIRRRINSIKWEDASTFGNGENRLLVFLAACNAVNKDRDEILPEDVVISYKTYLKLLNTDITKLEL